MFKSKSLFFHLLFLGSQFHIFSTSSTDPDARRCLGTTSGMSVGEDRFNHYSKMLSRYQNCTIVQGNLEINGLDNPQLDVSFLQDIEVVTGYVVIALNSVPYLPLEKLRMIRGRELFRGQYALYITVNYNSQDLNQALRELRLKSLTEIVQGSVYIDKNRLCYADTISWDDILNPFSRNTGRWVVQVEDESSKICAPCDPSCNGRCWGEGPDMCQTLTSKICSNECGYARCRGPTRDDCCDSECAVGCTGPTNHHCIECLHVNDGGLCKEFCPPARSYDPQTQRTIPNPHFKYHYLDTCVDQCPSYLLIEGNSCVKSCRVGYHNDGTGSCVQCKNGVCDKRCYGVGHQDGELRDDQTVDYNNIHFFEGCKILVGNLVFQSFAFSGDNHTGLPPINISQLEAFSDLKVITGYMRIFSWPSQLTDFSVFQNLQRIEGATLYRDLVALVIQDNVYKGSYYLNQITSLGFRSLKQITHGNVYLGYLKSLCFDRMINWSNILKHPVTYRGFVNGVLLRKNKLLVQCNGTKCDAQCTPDGCWGPGPRQCLECEHVLYNGTCYGQF